MDYASWANVHAYIMQDWCQISLLLNVQHVIYGFRIDVLTMVIMIFLMTKRGFKGKKYISRLVYFGDGVNTFQGLRCRIVIQNQCQHVPFVNGMHYMVHQTNLAIQTFLHLPSYLFNIRRYLQLVFMFILAIAPRDLEFTKMVKIIEIKRSKILHIKTMC
jgi:hypothetical protein